MRRLTITVSDESRKRGSITSKMEKREKKANFTDKENLQLLEQVHKHYALLTQMSKVACMSSKKRYAWLEITKFVNAVGGHGRAPAAVQKRWKDMRDAVKNRPKTASRTGAGPPVPPAPYEEIILQILGESTTVNGIMDTAAGDTFSTQEFEETTSNNDLTGPINYINLDFPEAEQRDISPDDQGDILEEGSQIYNISIIHPETTHDGGTISPSPGLTYTGTVMTERERLASTPLKDHCQSPGPAHVQVGKNGHAAEGRPAGRVKRSSSTICRGILKKRKCSNENEEECNSEDEVTLTKKFMKAQIAIKNLKMDVLKAEKAHRELEIERLKFENEDRKEKSRLERRVLELRVKKLEMELQQNNVSV